MQGVVGMEVLHCPRTAAVGGCESIFVEELQLSCFGVILLMSLEPFGKLQTARAYVDSPVPAEQSIASGKDSVFKKLFTTELRTLSSTTTS